MNERLTLCPVCKGEMRIQITDDEGNWHNEVGYEDNPWSGLWYEVLHVENDPDCPLVNGFCSNSIKEVIAMWNKLMADVVRCEECRFWDRKDINNGMADCALISCSTDSKFYCAIGERITPDKKGELAQ